MLEAAYEGTTLAAIDNTVTSPYLCQPLKWGADLDGGDLSLLLRSGWAPTGLVMGVGAVVAHDDVAGGSCAQADEHDQPCSPTLMRWANLPTN